MTDIDDDLAAAAEEAERELEGEEVEDEEDSIAPSISPPIAQPAPAPRLPRTGVRRKRRLNPAAGSQQTVTTLPTDNDPARPRSQNDGTKNISLIWTSLCEDLVSKGYSPGSVWIRVKKFTLGPNRTPSNATEDLEPVDGQAVCGNENVTAGEELIQYVTDVFHMTAAIPGPAKYVFGFYNKTGSSSGIAAAQGELILGDPSEIKRRREAAAMVQRRREIDRGGYAVGMNGSASYAFRGGPSVMSSPTFMPPIVAPAAPTAPPAPAPPIFVGASPELEAQRQQLASERQSIAEAQARIARSEGIYEERARMEGLLPPRQAAPVENEADKEARLVGAVVKALAISGLLPPPTPPTPVLNQQTVAQTVSSPLATLREAFKQMREFRAMDDEMREAFAPDESDEKELPPPPSVAIVPAEDPYAFSAVPMAGEMLGVGNVMTRKKKPDETAVDYVVDLARTNPAAAIKLAEKLMQGPLGNAIAALLQNTAVGKMMAAKNMAAQSQIVEHPQPASTATPTMNGTASVPPPPPMSGGLFGGAARKSGFNPGG